MKKLLLTTLALFSTLTLAACGSSEKQDLQDSIQEKGKLVVATSPDYAPFEFKALIDGKDTIVGSDILLAQAIADELGVELEISPMSFDNVLASLQTGKADMAIAGLSYTKERAAVYDFSDAYYTTENAILIQASQASTLTSIDSLAGQQVAAQKGTIEEGLAKEQLPESTVIGLTAMGEAINQLKTGKVQALVLEKPVAEGYLAQNSDLALATFALQVEDGDAKAIAMPKGSDKLVKTVNKVIADLEAKDGYQAFITEAAQLTKDAVE